MSFREVVVVPERELIRVQVQQFHWPPETCSTLFLVCSEGLAQNTQDTHWNCEAQFVQRLPLDLSFHPHLDDETLEHRDLTWRQGQPNLVVLIDETFVTEKKRNKGRFQRGSAGHTTIIIGFFKLDISSEPRVGTGRTLLIIVPDRTCKTIEDAIRRYVRA